MPQNDQKYSLRLTLNNLLGEELVLQSQNVITLSITESVLCILPKIELVINDNGSLLESFPVSDKMSIAVTIDNGIEDEPTINSEYIISSFYAVSDTVENQHLTFKIAGYQKAEFVFSPYLRASYTGSSNDVISQIANEVGMGFDERVRGVEDNVWYQSGNNYQFIKHVGDRSFVDDDGIFVYGDKTGNLVYTSYKTEASKETVHNAVYDRNRVENIALASADGNKMYYDGYTIMNNVEMYNNTVLYGGSYSYYNLTEYIYTNVELNMKTTDRYNQNENYSDNGAFSIGIGLINDESLFDTIYKGKIQNAFYKYALFSNNISLNINNSTNVNLFEKVDLDLQSTTTRESLVEPLSGEYMIGSITYNVTRNQPLTKQIILCRYGINRNPQQQLIGDII